MDRPKTHRIQFSERREKRSRRPAQVAFCVEPEDVGSYDVGGTPQVDDCFGRSERRRRRGEDCAMQHERRARAIVPKQQAGREIGRASCRERVLCVV